MTDSVADRVREQVSGFAGGTGAITLTGTPVAGFQSFLSGWGASGTGDYCIQLGSQWEVGFGTLNAGGTTLTRTTVYGSYSGGTFTAGTACTFSAGTLDVFGDIPAELAHYLNMREITVASASTCDIGAAQGSNIVVSGTTTITSFGTKKNRRRFVRFSGILTLTNGSTLVLPGGANITTAAGDQAIFDSDNTATPIWRCVSYQRANGLGPFTLGVGLAVAAGVLGVGLTTLSNYLSGDVALNNSTFTDGPSVAQGTTGVFLCIGTITIADTAGSEFELIKLYDGTTTIASTSSQTVAANTDVSVTIVGLITNPAGNIRIAAKSQTNTSKMKFNDSGLSKDSGLIVIRIG